MSVLPPSWALHAVALDGSGDPHLTPGIHLRVILSPEVGLPVCPLVVYRLSGGEAYEHLSGLMSADFAWVDSLGRVLTPPFEVHPGNPITGTILRKPLERAIAVAVTPGKASPPLTHHRIEVPEGPSRLRLEAFITTAAGPRIVGRRDAEPLYLGAPRIDGVILSGSGTVQAAAWVKAPSRFQGRKGAFLLDLPVPSAPRYRGLVDALSRAKDRVHRGAPTRYGLHDAPEVAGPAAAPAASPSAEWARVAPLAQELEPYLKAVVADLSDRPQSLTRSEALTEGVPAGSTGDVAISCLGALLAGSADPGLARWLGLMEVDDDPAALAGPFTLYFVRAFLAVDPARLSLIQRLGLLGLPPLAADLAIPELPSPVPQRSADDLPIYDFMLPVLVFPGNPPAPPPAPGVGAPLVPSAQVGPSGTRPLGTGDHLGTWSAEFIPPEARREITLPLGDLVAAPTLAFARQEPGGTVPLNTDHPTTGRALSLIPAIPEDQTTPGSGRLVDPAAPPEGVTYRIAQADWFGRWSPWSTRPVGAKGRTPPPPPILTLAYAPADAEPIDDDPRFGRLVARIALPQPEDLAAGSRPLVSAQLAGTIGGAPVTVHAPIPASPGDTLEVTLPPPAGVIPRAGRVEAEFTATFHDGVIPGPVSAPPQRLTLVDPRPPPALTLDPTLRYSARPDALGRARVTLEWPSQGGRRYRVYSTDETRLRSVMADRAAAGSATASALLAALDAAPDAAYRGAAWTDPQFTGLFTRELFSNLTASALDGTGGTLRWSHDLSGALKVLSFFKIVALSADNVESPFTAATLLPVAVPSGGPPPRPLLDFVGFSEEDDGEAILRVTAVRGPQPAARWRLRRSFATADEPLRMPVVAEGAIPEPPAAGPTTFEIVDADLPPWTRASWRVEVQAPSPPGSTTPGEWSSASGVVGGARIPPPPAAAADLALDPATLELTWTHPEPLRRGAMGGYRFDLYRRRPGEREERVTTIVTDDPGALLSPSPRIFRFAIDPAEPPQTTLRLVTIDPMGRLSPPSPSVQRS